MNKQRKVVITTTYNEMGIIIDTKVEEVAQPETIHCKDLQRDDWKEVIQIVADSPTVIEAEGSET